MPELPEVETVVRGLQASVAGKTLEKLVTRREGLRFPFPITMAAQLAGKKLQSITRRAKYIVMHFSGGQAAILHLGMSGKIIVYTHAPKHYGKHDHVLFEWKDKSVTVFSDPRRFGIMDVTSEKELTQYPAFKHLGVEPLTTTFNGASLYKSLQLRKAPIKNVLMDQRVIAGIGNIYACEALFESRIHPARSSNKVSKAEAKSLAANIKKVLNAAITSGGSTLRDYVRSSGESGYFQHHFKVYGRKGKPCTRCKTPIALLQQAGRSTFYCPHCQKK